MSAIEMSGSILKYVLPFFRSSIKTVDLIEVSVPLSITILMIKTVFHPSMVSKNSKNNRLLAKKLNF